MSDEVIASVAGLQISNSTFSASPPGSLLVANNVVMPQKGVVEPVRGQNRLSVIDAGADRIPFALTEFQGGLIANYAAQKLNGAYGLGLDDGAGHIADYSGGPYNPVDDTGGSDYGRMKFGFAGQYLNFCTTTGPKALEDKDGTPRNAGLLRMPDAIVRMSSASNLGANGVGLDDGKARAYRTVLRRPTSDGVSLLSPPSGRAVVANSLVAQVGQLVRTGGATVTATFTGLNNNDTGTDPGDTFTLSPGEANFPAAGPTAGKYVIATRVDNVLTWPSAGANVANTSIETLLTGPRPVAVFATLSDDATTSDFVRIYRSRDTSSATVDPFDEMFLVAELALTNTDISNGFVSYLDTVPQAVTSDPLYTNPQTGEGAAQANFQPPLYRDLAFWGGRMWYADTTGQQSLNVQMLGVGPDDGVQDGDTFTLDIPGAASTPYVFTFKNTSTAPDEIPIRSDSTPSVNIQLTTQNLIQGINFAMNADSVPLSAYYESAQNEAPGKFLLESTSYAQAAFGVKVSRVETWTPALNATTDTNSDNERVPNGLAYSKLAQAEAVPPVNFTTIGSKNYPLARVIGLQNALLCFKEGDGIYSVTGQFPFQVLQISTANIIAPDACCFFADSAFVYTDQGILRVTDSGGATVVSRPIETVLNELRIELMNETHDYAFAVPYETERRIMFFVPYDFTVSATGTDRVALAAFCYNNATGAWTGPIYSEQQAFSGVVRPSVNKLALGIYDYAWATARVTQERKTGTYLDIANARFSTTITAVAVGGDDLVVELASLTDVAVGDGLEKGAFRAKISALRPDVSATAIEVYESIPWTTGSCNIWKHYDAELQFLPFGSPSARKTLTRLAWLFKPESFANYAGLSTLLTDQIQALKETPATFPGFGLTPFGEGPFGNPTPMVFDVNPLDPKWTNAAQFFVGFKLSEVWAKFKCQGFVADVAMQSGPVGRGR